MRKQFRTIAPKEKQERFCFSFLLLITTFKKSLFFKENACKSEFTV